MPKLVYNEQILSGGIPKNQVGNILGNFATEYDSTSTYGVGNYVVYDGLLYKCITEITEGEEFDSTKWEKTDCGSEFERLNSNLNDYHTTKELLNVTKYGITFRAWKKGNIVTVTLYTTSVTTELSVGNKTEIIGNLGNDNAPFIITRQLMQTQYNDGGRFGVYVNGDGNLILGYVYVTVPTGSQIVESFSYAIK